MLDRSIPSSQDSSHPCCGIRKRSTTGWKGRSCLPAQSTAHTTLPCIPTWSETLTTTHQQYFWLNGDSSACFWTCKSSRQITWFSRISLVDSLCRKSFRQLATFLMQTGHLQAGPCASWNRPFFLRESIRCQRTSFCSYFLKYLGWEWPRPWRERQNL